MHAHTSMLYTCKNISCNLSSPYHPSNLSNVLLSCSASFQGSCSAFATCLMESGTAADKELCMAWERGYFSKQLPILHNYIVVFISLNITYTACLVYHTLLAIAYSMIWRRTSLTWPDPTKSLLCWIDNYLVWSLLYSRYRIFGWRVVKCLVTKLLNIIIHPPAYHFKQKC